MGLFDSSKKTNHQPDANEVATPGKRPENTETTDSKADAEIRKMSGFDNIEQVRETARGLIDAAKEGSPTSSGAPGLRFDTGSRRGRPSKADQEAAKAAAL